MDSTPEAPSTPLSVKADADSGASGVGPSNATPLLSLRGVSKQFGAVQALRGVDLDIPNGQVTALIGDNGAGKSTLIKTISGIWAPSEGHIFWKGEEVHVHSPRDAARLGIATVYQDLALCDNLDIVQNLYLGREETDHGLLDEIKMELTTIQTLKDLSVSTVRKPRKQWASRELRYGQRRRIDHHRRIKSRSDNAVFNSITERY
jgi:ABC-type sugar transport system ATPase subunit